MNIIIFIILISSLYCNYATSLDVGGLVGFCTILHIVSS